MMIVCICQRTYQLILVQDIDKCCPKAFPKASSAPVKESPTYTKQLLRSCLEDKWLEFEYSLAYEPIVDANY